MADAGYEDGLELTLHVPNSGGRPDLAAVLQDQWADAGVNIEISVEPEEIYYGENGWLEVDLGITGWGSRPYPQLYLDVMLVSGAVWNESHFSDEEFDRLAAITGSTLDEQERIEASEAQRQADLRQEIDARFPRWVGFGLAVFCVFAVGFFMASFFGSRTNSHIELPGAR